MIWLLNNKGGKKMNKKIILFLILLLLFSILLINYSYLQEEEKEEEVLAFITGDEYLAMPENIFKMFYVYGLSDMYSYFIFRYHPEIYPDFIGKIKRMTVQQITAIFDKYLEEHPEEWHFSAANIFDNVMWETLEKL